jgi:hypothetical protein
MIVSMRRRPVRVAENNEENDRDVPDEKYSDGFRFLQTETILDRIILGVSQEYHIAWRLTIFDASMRFFIENST